MIYHLVPHRQFLSSLQAAYYQPASLAKEGFIHCSLEASVIPVANDYFGAETDTLLLLKINPAKVAAPTKYEAPIPQAGAGTGHLNSAPVFPHVYGPIELTAIEGIGMLGREHAQYRWPKAFSSLQEFLNTASGGLKQERDDSLANQ